MSSGLEYDLAQVLTQKGLRIAVAESCTGGLLGGLLVGVPGSSNWFEGGVISYSNAAKETLLGVPYEALLTYGAVSQQVAEHMARGARLRLGVDAALSITGIAGPGGGTPEKPVGLTWIGFSDAAGESAQRYIWASDRQGNRDLSVQAALEILLAWAQTQKG